VTGPTTARSAPDGFATTERSDGTAVILAVSGNVDMAAAPALADQVGGVLRRRPPVFIIDLTEVNFLTTAGMSILLQAHHKSEDLSLAFRVVADGPMTARPMQLLGIDDLLEMYPTLQSALNAH
jgi:anti-sigma B factor antagonist